MNMGVISLPIATIMSDTDGRTPVNAPVEVSSLSMFMPLFTKGFYHHPRWSSRRISEASTVIDKAERQL